MRMIEATESNGPEYGRSLNGAGVRRISRVAKIGSAGKITRRIGTWNVRSMFESGKIHNTVREMRRLRMDILGISEMRWQGTGDCRVDGFAVYHSGDDSQLNRNGVAIIVSEALNRSVLNVVFKCDRLMMVQFAGWPVNINVLQAYAPTSSANDDDIEQFYNGLSELINLTKSRDMNLIIGDFNAKIGEGQYADIVGKFGLGERNERGERLIDFCSEHSLSIINTYFKLPKRRLYTWRSPADNYGNIVRNQIDYIIVKSRFRNAIKSAKTYPGADVPSDHNLLMAEYNMKFKKIKIRAGKKKLDVEKLKDPVVSENLTALIDRKIGDEGRAEGINEKWEALKTSVLKAADEVLGYKGRKLKNAWITDEILDKMDERRRYKGMDQSKYKDLHKEIRRMIRVAKEQWLSDECAEIEEFESKQDLFNMHRKIKQMAGLERKGINSRIIREDGTVLTQEEELLEWKRYVEHLFEGERSPQLPKFSVLEGPPILVEEVEKAIRDSKARKAVGPDEISPELLKSFSPKCVQTLTDIFNLIYDKGTYPEDWLRSILVTIPKKPSPKKCEDYRMISLLSHVLKVFLRIIHARIYAKIETQVSNSQFGFLKGLGTRDALFAINVLVQRCQDMNRPVFLAFIDFEKAFDMVNHEKMMNILHEDCGVDEKDLQCIGNLYWSQKANVRINNDLTDDIAISKGVRQGCILSPGIFNVYSERVFKEALHEAVEGIKINGITVNNIRYADDTLMIAGSIEELQSLLNKVASACNDYGLKLNINKTKFMVVGRGDTGNVSLSLNGVPIEQVRNIKYLGSQLNEDWDSSREIRLRIGMARATFNRMRPLFCCHNLSLPLRTRVLRCYVFSCLFYGMEAWTIKGNCLKRLEAFEMWCYRRMLKIKWTDRITNQEVLLRMSKKTEVVDCVKRRKLKYFGHVMRQPDKYDLLKLVMEGKIEGRRGVGRRRTSWLKNLRDWYGVSSLTLFRAAVDKVKIALMLAKVR